MKLSEKNLPSPALARGLVVLDYLSRNPNGTLEEISRALELPKTSVMRLLQTMEGLGVVTRRGDRTYQSVKILVERSHFDDFQSVLDGRLRFLCEELGETVEWYEPSEYGMLLMKHHSPSDKEVMVVARRGYLRSWTVELDSVLALGYAYYDEAPKLKDGLVFYSGNAVKSAYSVKDAEQKIVLAKQLELAKDEFYNTNSVRRISASVIAQNKFQGVMSIAETHRFDREPHWEKKATDVILQAAKFDKKGQL